MRGSVSEAAALRFASTACAVALVWALVAMALLIRMPRRVEAYRELAVRVTLSPVTPAQQAPAHGPRVRRANTSAPALSADRSAEIDAAMLAGLAGALRCATFAARRANPEACAGAEAWGPAPRRALAIAPVEGVQTKDGQTARTIIRAATLVGRIYLGGAAQSYAGPSEDPQPEPILRRRF